MSKWLITFRRFSSVANFGTFYFLLKIKILAKRKRELTTKFAIARNGCYRLVFYANFINSNVNIINVNANIINSNVNIINVNVNIINSNVNIINVNANIINSNVNIINVNANIINSNANIINVEGNIINYVARIIIYFYFKLFLFQANFGNTSL